jgi:hypothetical protein
MNLRAEPECAVEQADRVGAAGQQDDQRLSRANQATGPRNLESTFLHKVSLPSRPDRVPAAP